MVSLLTDRCLKDSVLAGYTNQMPTILTLKVLVTTIDALGHFETG